MEKVESTIRMKTADEGNNGSTRSAEGLQKEEGEAAGERSRPLIADVGTQPLRAAIPSRELAKKPLPIRKPESGAFHKTLGLVKTVLPLMQKALPLLDGNVAAALANLLMPAFQAQHVDLGSLEAGVTRLRADHAALQTRMEAQGTALKQVGSRLESLRDSAERLSVEQKELAEELHVLRTRMSVFAWIGLGLLGVLVLVNALLLLRVAGIWR